MRVPVAIVVVLVVLAFVLGWLLRGGAPEPERTSAVGGASSVDAPSAAPAAASTSTEPSLTARSERGPTSAPPAPHRPVPATPSARVDGPAIPTTSPNDRRVPAAVAPSPTTEVPGAEPSRMVWSVDREGIQGAVREALPDIRECYSAWLRENPALAGKVTVRFTIEDRDEDGEVTSAAVVASDVEHPLMEGCVLNVMRGLAFESPGDEPITVSYPIVLMPAADE